MLKSVVFCCLTLFALFASCSRQSAVGNPEEDLSAWRMVGAGRLERVDGSVYRFTEGADSRGVTLVSPHPYGRNVTLSFKIKPERYEGVCVVLLSASDGAGGLDIPPDDDGGMAFWSEGSVRNYMIAFHVAYHQPNLFIRKNPGMTEIAMTPDVVNEEKWYDMEIGRSGERIWVKADGVVALEGTDPESGGVPGGHIGIRLRGPGDGSYSCLISDVTILEQ